MNGRKSHESTLKSPYFPPPSLHVALLRADPWNEFLNQRSQGQNVLKFDFASRKENSLSDLREQVEQQLTVISGPGPNIPSASESVPENIVSFLFRSPVAVPETDSVGLVSLVPAENTPVAASDAPAAVVDTLSLPAPSLWARFTSAVEDLKNTAYNPVPSWFSKETSLVVPTDAAVRAVLGSVYGGTRGLVKISVRVIEAVDVPVADFWGTSDPYVCLALVRGVGGLTAGRMELLPTIGSLKSSSPQFATLNPKWNQTLELDPADLLSVISDAVLHVSLWDKDIVKQDDPLGFAVVSLIDALQASGVSPYPILPIQVTGSLIGPHAGLFVKIQLRMVQKVGCVSITPIALQGFTNGWLGYQVRVDAKVTGSDPVASALYMANGLCQPEASIGVLVGPTGHAVWPVDMQPVTLLFSYAKKSKPFLHLTLKGNGLGADPGQVAVRIGMLERLAGVAPLRLQPMDGSPSREILEKCALYCGVECQLG